MAGHQVAAASRAELLPLIPVLLNRLMIQFPGDFTLPPSKM
jgi:hypothetical protein